MCVLTAHLHCCLRLSDVSSCCLCFQGDNLNTCPWCTDGNWPFTETLTRAQSPWQIINDTWLITIKDTRNYQIKIKYRYSRPSDHHFRHEPDLDSRKNHLVPNGVGTKLKEIDSLAIFTATHLFKLYTLCQNHNVKNHNQHQASFIRYWESFLFYFRQYCQANIWQVEFRDLRRTDGAEFVSSSYYGYSLFSSGYTSPLLSTPNKWSSKGIDLDRRRWGRLKDRFQQEQKKNKKYPTKFLRHLVAKNNNHLINVSMGEKHYCHIWTWAHDSQSIRDRQPASVVK